VSFHLFTILAFSVFMPVIIGFIKIRQILKQRYLPVFLYVLLAFTNNLISYILIKQGISNHVNSNVYVLFALALLVWQFYIWNGGGVAKYRYAVILLAGIWLLENVIINRLSVNNSIFRFCFSFTILFFCVDTIHRQIFFNSQKIITNPTFLICIGLMIHYTFKAFIETFYFFSWVFETRLIIQLNFTLGFFNLVTNIFISIAFLCMQYKPKYYQY